MVTFPVLPLTGFIFLNLFGLLECLIMWLISMPVIKVSFFLLVRLNLRGGHQTGFGIQVQKFNCQTSQTGLSES